MTAAVVSPAWVIESFDLSRFLGMLSIRRRLNSPPEDLHLHAALLSHGSPLAEVERSAWLSMGVATSDEKVSATAAVLRRTAELVIRWQPLAEGGRVVTPTPAHEVPSPGAQSEVIARLLVLADALGVEVRYASSPLVHGVASRDGWVFVDPAADLEWVLGHELGHMIDFRQNLMPISSAWSCADRERLADDIGALLIERAIVTAVDAEAVGREVVERMSAPTGSDEFAIDMALEAWWRGQDLSGWVS